MSIRKDIPPDTLTIRQAGIGLLAFLHLVSVVLFVWTDWLATPANGFARLGRSYLNLSGSIRDYAYFAPAVASDLRAGFLVEGPESKISFINFVSANKEVGFRYNCVIASGMRAEKHRDLLAQSWAAFILGNQPGAKAVTVVSQAYMLPTMSGYRQGRRPAWRTVYLGKFEKK